MYNTVIVNQKLFRKQLDRIPLDIKKNILKKIENLVKFPDCDFDVKKLRNFDTADFRIRIADFRVLFNVDSENKEILIIAVLHRKESYKK